MRLARTLRLAAGLAMVGSMTLAIPAAYAETPDITREIRHGFTSVQHYDAGPCFPAVTEYYYGNDHLVVVDMGDSVHVTFGETFQVLVVPDDPALPTVRQQGTDAFHLNLNKSGTEVFTESFHQIGHDFKVDYYRTFVYANGEVQVDREIVRNFPSCP